VYYFGYDFGEIAMRFSELLRTKREGAGLTQEALARLADTSVGNVRNYEQGIRFPSFPIVVKLAAALGVDCTAFSACDDVAGGGDEEKPAVKKPRKR
jgi:transcriptional regulator with XRE-family HTH domain